MRERRVGTFTLGCMLVTFGVLFIIETFTHALTYGLIFKLWPVVFILLGVEILASLRGGNEVKFKLDAGSIVMMILMMGVAATMAGADFCFQHYALFY